MHMQRVKFYIANTQANANNKKSNGIFLGYIFTFGIADLQVAFVVETDKIAAVSVP